MATELQIQLKQAGVGGKTLNLAEDEIIKVITDTLGARVLYFKAGARKREVVVVETPAQIEKLCKTLLKVTDAADSSTSDINASHIIIIDTKGTGSVIKYDAKAAYPQFLEVKETKSAINKTTYELAGQTAYTINEVSKTTNSFILAAAHGDKTATFAAGKVFSVISSTGNDGTFTVTSSSYSGATLKTTIVATETIADSTDDGSILIVV